MSGKQTFSHPSSAMTPFVNSTTTMSDSSTRRLTIFGSSSSSLSSSSPLSLSSLTTTMSPVSLSPAVFAPGVPPYDSSGLYSPSSTPSPTSPSYVPTTAIPSPPAVSSPTAESVPSPFLIPTAFSSLPPPVSSVTSPFLSNATASPIIDNITSSSSASDIVPTVIINTAFSPTSSIASAIIPSRFTSGLTGNLSSSRTTTPNETQPSPPLDASPQGPSITLINPSTPPTNPTRTSTPQFTEQGKPPILVILAIVISVVVSVLLLTIILRKLSANRGQRRSHRRQALQPNTRQGDFPRPLLASESVGSTHSFAATYHSAPRDAVRVMAEGPLADEEGWHWSVLPSHPGYQDESTGLGAMRGGAMDPAQWSVGSLDGSAGVPDRRPGTSKRDARVYQSVNKVGIGRAY
ncbi:hypothetical protein F5Y09DRAFT_322415 [Xylaria sp. FL1042]|nr:hypothetical protein F5Y09DRAFT_322415 [Xylaria sp. FL1042]